MSYRRGAFSCTTDSFRLSLKLMEDLDFLKAPTVSYRSSSPSLGLLALTAAGKILTAYLTLRWTCWKEDKIACYNVFLFNGNKSFFLSFFYQSFYIIPLQWTVKPLGVLGLPSSCFSDMIFVSESPEILQALALGWPFLQLVRTCLLNNFSTYPDCYFGILVTQAFVNF